VGDEHIPVQGAAVLVCNHVSFVDAVLLMAASPRPIRFMMDHRIFRVPVLGWLFKLAKAIPIAPRSEDPLAYEAAFEAAARCCARATCCASSPRAASPATAAAAVQGRHHQDPGTRAGRRPGGAGDPDGADQPVGLVLQPERAADGAQASVEIAGRAAAGSALAVGTVVTVSVIGAGVLLSAGGEVIAFIPNKVGRALLHHERLSS
jgi:hypothetical protein